MNEVKRYDVPLYSYDLVSQIREIPNGDFVLYKDYEYLSAQLSEAQEEIGRMNISLELQADRVDKLIDENVKAESELAKEQHENEQLIILRDEYEELVGNVALILGCTDEWSNCHDHRCCIAENATRIVRENAALRERLKKVEEVYNENKNEENEGFNEEMKNVFWQAIKAACEA